VQAAASRAGGQVQHLSHRQVVKAFNAMQARLGGPLWTKGGDRVDGLLKRPWAELVREPIRSYNARELHRESGCRHRRRGV
jgi:hypothetical protein